MNHSYLVLMDSNNSSESHLFISPSGCDLVVWSHERCCINGSCIQQGIKSRCYFIYLILYEAFNDTQHLLDIAVYKGWENGFARECNHDHQYHNRLSL